ncbi:hypothetical protein DFQ27_009624 [Actinomortierella ambigua]|uniref:phosphoserine transaminase n=1 Tax=Actinomortierella ambigua TaxID=1343610 RepID=A0A9P6QEG0_9FUNG|nr:hypothetical protein DFQ27_009624 [Actinomortierella ambigua]
MSATAATQPASKHVWNFGAGPALLNRSVLERAQREFLDYEGSGMSLMELSHRSDLYEQLNNKAQDQLRQLMDIPENYKIIFMQGGGHTQFAAVVYNLLAWRLDQNKKTNSGEQDWRNIPVDYIVTGSWSSKAVEEATRLGANVRVVANAKTAYGGKFAGVPEEKTWLTSSKDQQAQDKSNLPAYLYYCDNETVNGVEFPFVPSQHDVANVPLVCDMSSNILSRKVDVTKFGVIYAGAQKNIGPAGVSVVIVREDLLKTAELKDGMVPVPLMLDYNTMVKNNSLYNTPPMFAIYISSLVFDWLLNAEQQKLHDGAYHDQIVAAAGGRSDLVGIDAAVARNARKASKLYNAIEQSRFCKLVVTDKPSRSRMNVPFRILVANRTADMSDEDKKKADAEDKAVEARFVREAEAKGLFQLAGHRSVGGIRASIYNAMPEEGVDVLVQFIKDFEAQL